jgi:hypothetical protein
MMPLYCVGCDAKDGDPHHPECECDPNNPYDPDMTVDEALRKGLIAIIDSGRIASENYTQCGAYNQRATAVCTRSKGHEGVHAYVMRWDPFPEDHVVPMHRRMQPGTPAYSRDGRVIGIHDGAGKVVTSGIVSVPGTLRDQAKMTEELKALATNTGVTIVYDQDRKRLK